MLIINKNAAREYLGRHFLFVTMLIKRRIECVEILFVKLICCEAESFAETLKMNNFSCAQEFNRFYYIGIVNKAENIVIGGACFLLRCKVFGHVGDNITFALNVCRGKGRA